MWEDNRKLMTPIHSECLNHARENEYAQVRYAQGDWQTRDPELILYLEVPGKPPLVGVGLTERAVRFLRESGELDWEIRDVTPAISCAGTIMRVSAGRDDIFLVALSCQQVMLLSYRTICVGSSLLPIQRFYRHWSTYRAVYCPCAT